jgi:hypothetical protein
MGAKTKGTGNPGLAQMYADSFGAVSQARDKVGGSVTWRLPKAFRLRPGWVPGLPEGRVARLGYRSKP